MDSIFVFFVVMSAAVVPIVLYRFQLAPEAKQFHFAGGSYVCDEGDRIVLHLAHQKRDVAMAKTQVLLALGEYTNTKTVNVAASSVTTSSGFINAAGGLSGTSYTRHSSGGSYEKVTGKTATVSFGQMSEMQTHIRLLLSQCPDHVIPAGATTLGDTYYPPTHHLVSCSPGRIALLKRWLSRHGVRLPPDETAAEASFLTHVQATLATLRQKYNFSAGELDAVGLDRTDPSRIAYYIRLSVDASSAFVYMADKDITWKVNLIDEPIVAFNPQNDALISDWHAWIRHPIYGANPPFIRLTCAQGERHRTLQAQRKAAWETTMRREHNA